MTPEMVECDGYVAFNSGGGRGKMGVSKNRRENPPKWMVKIMENPIKMDDLGGKPTIFGNTQMEICEKAHGLLGCVCVCVCVVRVTGYQVWFV